MSNINNIFQIARVDTAVHFTIVSPGKHNYQVGLYDAESELPIHVERNWELTEGGTFFIEPSVMLLNTKNVYIEIISPSGESQRAYATLIEGNTRYPVVLGKKFMFAHNARAAFYTLIEVFYERLYDKDYVKVEKDDVVLDIGANLGMFAVYAQNFHPSRVVAVEPGPEEYPKLLENLKSFANATAYKYAVTNKTGTVQFSSTVEGVSNHIANTFDYAQHGNHVYQTVDVDAIDINDLIKEAKLDRIDYLKIDCEGAELDIFVSIDKEYLRNSVRKIAVEYHTLEIKANLLDIILSNGFELENREAVEETKEVGMFYFYNKNYFQ
jgi:FkbM family methyltransferase